MRLRSITTGTIATVLVVGLLGTPAAATRIETPIPAPEIGQEFAEVSFAVVGDMDVVVGETVEATDLDKVGVAEGVARSAVSAAVRGLDSRGSPGDGGRRQRARALQLAGS